MKKVICIVFVLFCLAGCTSITSILPNNKKTTDIDSRYIDLIEIVNEHDSFLSESTNYDINVEMSKIDGGYRYYVTIDNAKIAMYDIEAIAIEPSVNYEETMAANIGIFDETEYNMIPYQSNPSKGYVKGLVMSGLSTNEETSLLILVQWKKEDRTTSSREFFKLDVSYGD